VEPLIPAQRQKLDTFIPPARPGTNHSETHQTKPNDTTTITTEINENAVSSVATASKPDDREDSTTPHVDDATRQEATVTEHVPPETDLNSKKRALSNENDDDSDDDGLSEYETASEGYSPAQKKRRVDNSVVPETVDTSKGDNMHSEQHGGDDYDSTDDEDDDGASDAAV
jgi:hypothetical protein